MNLNVVKRAFFYTLTLISLSFLFQNCTKKKFSEDSKISASELGKLIFKSNFGPGVTVKSPQSIYPNGLGGWQELSGVDEETGFSWSKPILNSYFNGMQLITADPITLDTVKDYITNEIRQVPGPKGDLVYELFTNLKIKPPPGIGVAQSPLLINRPWDKGDVTDLYITYWFKFQPDLVDRLDNTVSSGNWRVLFEFKTGGYNNTSEGDYRIQTTVIKGSDNKLYWIAKGDNLAGLFPRVDYWTDRNKTIPVPVGEWFKFEVFWHRSNNNDGRYWNAINGKILFDHYGPNMGDFNLPINRIFIINAYSGGTPNVQSEMTGLEIWSNFPCGNGVSCYNEGF